MLVRSKSNSGRAPNQSQTQFQASNSTPTAYPRKPSTQRPTFPSSTIDGPILSNLFIYHQPNIL